MDVGRWWLGVFFVSFFLYWILFSVMLVFEPLWWVLCLAVLFGCLSYVGLGESLKFVWGVK